MVYYAAMESDELYMGLALDEARTAAADGEVPTGCVIVDANGTIIARAHNRTEGNVDATAHAEMLALGEAFKTHGNWRLVGCRLYVTKEPCPMCAGAIVLARPDAVIWGCSDPKRGGSTVFDIFRHPGINHHPKLVAGVLEAPCTQILKNFFLKHRKASERCPRHPCPVNFSIPERHTAGRPCDELQKIQNPDVTSVTE